jgi:hypothetical protein
MPPAVTLSTPAGDYAQHVAILLLAWLLVGWLLPALLLLPDAPEKEGEDPGPATAAAAGGGAGALATRAVDLLEAGVRLLLPAPRNSRQGDPPTGLVFFLRWWVVVQVSWGLCCVAAPLFDPHLEATPSTL